MFFGGLQESVESREITAQLLAKTELSDSFTRLLLQDAKGQALYCWLEGDPWTHNARAFPIGAQLTLGPYKTCKIPKEYVEFYSPEIAGTQVSDSCIHYPPNDQSVNVTLAEARQRFSLRQAIEEAAVVPGFRCDVFGAVVDIVQRDTCNDRLWRIKLSDESLAQGEFLSVHLFVKKNESIRPKFESLGDIVVLQGCGFQQFNGRPQASINKNSNGWGIFSFSTCTEIVTSPNFKRTDFLHQRINALRQWTAGFYASTTLCNQDLTVPRLGQLSKFRYKKVDVIGKVVRVCTGFPPGMCTILICDESGFAFIECYDFNFESVSEGCWAKARQVKVETTLKLDQYSSVVPIPEQFFDIQSRLRGADLPGMALITQEASVLLEQRISAFEQSREKLATRCGDDQIPLWSGREVVSPMSSRRMCRFKGLLVSVEPRRLLDCFHISPGETRFCALFRCLSDGEIVEVLVTEKEAKVLFNERVLQPTEEVLGRISEALEYLGTGNNWVELGVLRAVWDNRVLLKLHQTSII